LCRRLKSSIRLNSIVPIHVPQIINEEDEEEGDDVDDDDDDELAKETFFLLLRLRLFVKLVTPLEI